LQGSAPTCEVVGFIPTSFKIFVRTQNLLLYYIAYEPICNNMCRLLSNRGLY